MAELMRDIELFEGDENRIEARPCPFCGSRKIALIQHESKKYKCDFFQMGCEVCGSTGAKTSVNWAEDEYDEKLESAKIKALNRWNNRSEEKRYDPSYERRFLEACKRIADIKQM